MEDLGGGWTGSALELGFYGPRDERSTVFLEHEVCADGVFVFGVYEQSVHIEQACSDWREAGESLLVVFSNRYSGEPLLTLSLGMTPPSWTGVRFVYISEVVVVCMKYRGVNVEEGPYSEFLQGTRQGGFVPH